MGMAREGGTSATSAVLPAQAEDGQERVYWVLERQPRMPPVSTAGRVHEKVSVL